MALDPPASWLDRIGQHFALTDSSGFYWLEDVVPGAHTVEAADVPGYWSTTGSSVKVLALLHQTTTVNFGFYQPQRVYLPLVYVGRKW